ncbi:MAG: FkbM family methyltransferase [Leptospiraceae bacterium]|nr:FkbM family methyltransferase [Leptospiraceae bacterium]
MKKKINRYIVSIIALFFRFTAWFEFKILRQAKFQSLDQRQEYVFSSVEWEGGREHYVCFPYDQAISKHVYVDGHFGWTHVPRVLKILGSDFKLKTLIDIGANIGTISIPIVKRGLAERAIAFEPEPRNFRTLMANIYINGLADKIVAYNLALGSEEKDVIFELSTDNSGDHRVTVSEQDGMYSESRRKKITVKSKSLDEMFPVSKNNECLIWMDTQGYEGKILEGAKEICKARIPMVN